MYLSSLISQLLVLLLLMLTGFVCARSGIITPQNRQKLSTLTLSTAAPGTIISSALSGGNSSSTMLSAVALAALFYLAVIPLSRLLLAAVRTPKEERRLDEVMLIYTNVGFVGLPVVQSIYGARGVAVQAMFILVFNLSFFSYGILRMSGGKGLNLKGMINPCTIAAVIALIFGVTGWHLPGPIEKTLSTLGGMNTPMAMMIIGASMAHSDIRGTLKSPRIYRVCALSMLVLPVVVLLLVRLLPIDPMLAGVAVITAALPIASNCGMVSDLYTPGDLTASHGVIISTISCAVTLPLICALAAAML